MSTFKSLCCSVGPTIIVPPVVAEASEVAVEESSWPIEEGVVSVAPLVGPMPNKKVVALKVPSFTEKRKSKAVKASKWKKSDSLAMLDEIAIIPLLFL